GATLTYLGDPNNVYEKWDWTTGRRDKGGEFCLDCPWQFTAQAWNPWIYVDYFDSGDGWDVDLTVTNISTPPPTPTIKIDKNRARTWALVAAGSEAFFVSAGTTFVIAGPLTFDIPMTIAGGIFVGPLQYIAGKAFQHFDKLGSDPLIPCP